MGGREFVAGEANFATKCALLVQNSKKVSLRRAICDKSPLFVRNLANISENRSNLA